MEKKKGPARRKAFEPTEEQLEIIRQMLIAGKSGGAIAKSTGWCTPETVNKYRRKWGIPIVKRQAEYLKGVNCNGHTNICIDCKKACGDCSWSEWDVEKGGTAFKPVPGWKLEEYVLDGLPRQYIVYCPEFERG